jgi:hypothetical protein
MAAIEHQVTVALAEYWSLGERKVPAKQRVYTRCSARRIVFTSRPTLVFLNTHAILQVTFQKERMDGFQTNR